MGKKRTTPSCEAGDGRVQLDDHGLRLRLYRVGDKVAVELTERRPGGRPITQTVNFASRQELERWLEAERLPLERPLLYQALCGKLDHFWSE